MTNPGQATVQLYPGGPEMAPMGVGAWTWGDRLLWGYGRGYGLADVRGAFQASLAGGVTLFDTAEFYGFGESERLLGRFIGEQPAGGPASTPLLRSEQAHSPLDIAPRDGYLRSRVVVTTKFFPYPWRVRRQDLVRALRSSLARLGLPAVDLYLLHWPWPPVPVETWAEALADGVQAGLACSVGISNHHLRQTMRIQAVFARRGVTLAANQLEYNLLNRGAEKSGLLAACRDMGVTVIAYSPLAQGLLTGKYTPQHRPSGFRAGRFIRTLARIQPLVQVLTEIGRARGKTPAQVAINWAIAKGTLPIPGAKNARQAEQNAGALGWSLTADEVARLDEMSERVHG